MIPGEMSKCTASERGEKRANEAANISIVCCERCNSLTGEKCVAKLEGKFRWCGCKWFYCGLQFVKTMYRRAERESESHGSFRLYSQKSISFYYILRGDSRKYIYTKGPVYSQQAPDLDFVPSVLSCSDSSSVASWLKRRKYTSVRCFLKKKLFKLYTTATHRRAPSFFSKKFIPPPISYR